MHVNRLAALDDDWERELIVNMNGFAFLRSVMRCSALPRDTVTDSHGFSWDTSCVSTRRGVEYDSIGKEQLLNQTNSIKLFIPRTIRFRLANSVVMRIKPEKMSLCLYKFSLICYVCCYERRINIFILEARAHVLLTKKTIQFFDLI